MRWGGREVPSSSSVVKTKYPFWVCSPNPWSGRTLSPLCGLNQPPWDALRGQQHGDTVPGPTLQRVLCSHQSPDVVKSANTSAVRKEFSLLGLTLGGLLLPRAGREGSLQRAAVSSCCPYGSGSSCRTTAYMVGNTRRLFLQFQAAEKNEPSAKFSSAMGWLCTASLPGAQLGSLCGRRKEKVLYPAR